MYVTSGTSQEYLIPSIFLHFLVYFYQHSVSHVQSGHIISANLTHLTIDQKYLICELLDKPEQIAIRAPMILQELHYLLLIGPLGHVLRGLYAQGSQNSQVLQAVSILRRDLGAPVRMESLARQVGMSLSTLHRHFKTVTGLSPLQYLKQLRLHEAQRLMLMEDMRAASAALSVGYESVTQFSREYKRMFGEPPHRDIQRKRTLAPLGEAGAGGL